jgi:hypothetical protein
LGCPSANIPPSDAEPDAEQRDLQTSLDAARGLRDLREHFSALSDLEELAGKVEWRPWEREYQRLGRVQGCAGWTTAPARRQRSGTATGSRRAITRSEPAEKPRTGRTDHAKKSR